MARVILIATLSLLAATQAAGGPLTSGGLAHEWTTLAPELAVLAAEPGFPIFSASVASDRVLAPALVSLVFVNRLDRVEVDSGGHLRLAGAACEPDAAWSAVTGRWPVRPPVEERWHEIAALNDTSTQAVRPSRTPGRVAPARRIWPPGRPLRKAQVWLARKQP